MQVDDRRLSGIDKILEADRDTEMARSTIEDVARQAGVSVATVDRVLNGRAAISPEMALRLEGWLGVENGGRSHATNFDLDRHGALLALG